MKKTYATFGLIATAILLNGCQTAPVPVVDMAGVDTVQYNRDLADCYDETPAFAWGNWLATCLEGKGYTVLVGHDAGDRNRNN